MRIEWVCYRDLVRLKGELTDISIVMTLPTSSTNVMEMLYSRSIPTASYRICVSDQLLFLPVFDCSIASLMSMTLLVEIEIEAGR